jgi:hypothetical protein
MKKKEWVGEAKRERKKRGFSTKIRHKGGNALITR